jgi:putative hydrolase of the HAD superfamily
VSIWIYTDADNTLWDTDALFAEAQLTLLGAAEALVGRQGPATDRLQFVRQFDQAIATHHHARLRYPPALLIRALRAGLDGSAPEAAAHRALSQGSIPTTDEAEVLAQYADILAGVPPVLTGVTVGLQLAREREIPVYVISEGPLDLLQTRLNALGLDRLTGGALSAAKSPDLYARLRQRAAPREALMIGDQPDRDIRFAHEAGLKTVFVRGRFRPSWTQTADIQIADAIAENFLGAVESAVRWDSAPAG